MKLLFTVNGEPQSVEVPEASDVPDAIGQVHASVVAACGAGTPDRYLRARIADTLLNILVEQQDFEIGEALAAPEGAPA